MTLDRFSPSSLILAMTSLSTRSRGAWDKAGIAIKEVEATSNHAATRDVRMAFSGERRLKNIELTTAKECANGDTIMPSLQDECHQIRPWRASEFLAILSGR